MKNEVNLQEDGSRWCLLQGFTATYVFNRWGCKEEFRVNTAGHNEVYMIRLDDGWHYAHVTERSSCYAAAQAYAHDAGDGHAAWISHRIDNATFAITCAARQLAESQAEKSRLQDELAAYFHDKKSVNPAN